MSFKKQNTHIQISGTIFVYVMLCVTCYFEQFYIWIAFFFEGCYWNSLLSKVKILQAWLLSWRSGAINTALEWPVLSVHPNLEPKFRLGFPALSSWHGCTSSLLFMLVEAEVCTPSVALQVLCFSPAPAKLNGKTSGNRAQHSKLKHGNSRNM